MGPLGAGEAVDVIETVPCLGDYAEAWRSITQQPFVLQSVVGYRLDIVTIPPLLGPGRALTVSRSLQINVMGEEIEALLKKSAIEQVHGNSPGFFSFLFLVPKERGGEKTSHQPETVEPFHMTTLKEVGQSIRHGDWSITIDLRDTFLHVPVHKEYRRYLRFAWMERIYQFKRLPFGLTSSPQVFTDITRPLVEHCRIKGIRVIFYLDDILVLVSTRTLVCQHRDYVLNLLHQVGFKRIQKKCCLTPSQTFPYLEWDSISMQVSLPQTTLDHIRQLIEVITRAPTACTKGCMALLGMMNFATIAIAIGRFYCRPHQFCLPRTRYQQNFNNTKIQLSRRALDCRHRRMVEL